MEGMQGVGRKGVLKATHATVAVRPNGGGENCGAGARVKFILYCCTPSIRGAKRWAI